MKTAEAITTQEAPKISNNRERKQAYPNDTNWSHEKAIHDWENEGGALVKHESRSSI